MFIKAWNIGDATLTLVYFEMMKELCQGIPLWRRMNGTKHYGWVLPAILLIYRGYKAMVLEDKDAL